MMNKLWILLGLIALIPLVSAIDLNEGDVYTQAQLDNFDLSSYQTASQRATLFECQKEGSGFKFREWYHQPYSCFKVVDYGNQGYLIVRRYETASIHIPSYRICRDYDTKANCDTEFFGQMKDQVKNRLAKLIKWIENHKTPDTTGFSGDDFGGGLW